MTAAPLGLVIPTLGGGALMDCLEAVRSLDPAPRTVAVVASGGRAPDVHRYDVQLLAEPRRLGFADAVNLGIAQLDPADHVAVLNDDALPARDWLAPLLETLESDHRVAAVQGPVLDGRGARLDGCGIILDRWVVPVQAGRGVSPGLLELPPIIAVSGTAAVWRREALEAVRLADGSVLDPAFGSYLEDLDLGLRLHRLGWRAACVGPPSVRHLGSVSGRTLRWRHPWWLLSNRWRALAGNLTGRAVLRLLPVLLRGELRCVRTLVRHGWRSVPVAVAWWAVAPGVIARALRRTTPGARLERLPEESP